MTPAATAVPRPTSTVLDLSELPTQVFGHRESTWWGTIGFMIVESVTMITCVAAYFFVRRNFTEWPLLASFAPYFLLSRAAKRLDRAAAHRWCWVAVGFGIATVVLRALEFEAVHVRWDANAYGSAVWAILIAHGSLLLVDVLETGTLALIFALGREEPKHFVDATDNAFYSYFMILSWVPQYVIVYLFPRWT